MASSGHNGIALGQSDEKGLSPCTGGPGRTPVRQKGGGTAKNKSEVGSVLYNRGMISAMLTVEAIKQAQSKYGKRVVTGEEVRWGAEHLNLDTGKIKTLGFGDMVQPLKTSVRKTTRGVRKGVHPYLGRQGLELHVRLAGGGLQVPQPDDQGLGQGVRGREEDHAARLLEREVGRAVAGRPLPQPSPSDPGPRGTRREPRGGERWHGFPILDVNGIEVIYDHVILVLKGVSLAVPEGGIVALLGANGAGKTTTLKAISNLLRAERGEVTKARSTSGGERVDALNPSDLVKRGVVQVMEGRHCFAAPHGGGKPPPPGLHAQSVARRGAHDLERVYAFFPRVQRGAAGPPTRRAAGQR